MNEGKIQSKRKRTKMKIIKTETRSKRLPL